MKMITIILEFLSKHPEKKYGEPFCYHWLKNQLEISNNRKPLDEKVFKKSLKTLVEYKYLKLEYDDRYSLLKVS